jgi:hypothetical protein
MWSLLTLTKFKTSMRLLPNIQNTNASLTQTMFVILVIFCWSIPLFEVIYALFP